MKVCPNCGSEHVSQMATSGYFYGGSSPMQGVSGYSGVQGVSGVSGVSGSGISGYVGKVHNYGHMVTSQNPNPPVPQMAAQAHQAQQSPYPKLFSCAKCGWTGKENELMDDFKFEIKKAMKENGIEPPLPPIVNKQKVNEIVEAMQSCCPACDEKEEKADFKKLMNKIADVILGEKIKGGV